MRIIKQAFDPLLVFLGNRGQRDTLFEHPLYSSLN